MSLIKNKEGNFYPIEIAGTDWHCDWLWSTHRGCSFDCVYCSSKEYNVRFGGKPCEIRRLKGEWTETDVPLGHLRRFILPNNKIFISPYNDFMTINDDDKLAIFGKISASNEYWFDRDVIGHKEKNNFGIIMQTKKPAKYFDYLDLIPEGSWLGTTIETDKFYKVDGKKISKAPEPFDRYRDILRLRNNGWDKIFITLEPIMEMSNFHDYLLQWMKDIQPDLIFIGANTSKIQLPEPTNDELQDLIYTLYDIIGVNNVYLKSNIRRLIPAFYDGWKLAKEQKERSEL